MFAAYAIMGAFGLSGGDEGQAKISIAGGVDAICPAVFVSLTLGVASQSLYTSRRSKFGRSATGHEIVAY
jgi:hypothetical protein